MPGVRKNTTTSPTLLLLDTSKSSSKESTKMNCDSKQNIKEADVVVEHVESLIRSGVGEKDIGVESPYSLQVELLKSRLAPRCPGVEVASVDGFQGREKEAMVLSLVRSNTEAEVGFLAESRRINVSVTRARRSCIIIGDRQTLRSDTSLDSLWRYCQKLNTVMSVDKINL